MLLTKILSPIVHMAPQAPSGVITECKVTGYAPPNTAKKKKRDIQDNADEYFENIISSQRNIVSMYPQLLFYFN